MSSVVNNHSQYESTSSLKIENYYNDNSKKITEVVSDFFKSIQDLFFRLFQKMNDFMFNETDTVIENEIEFKINLPYPKNIKFQAHEVDNQDLKDILSNKLGFKAIKKTMKDAGLLQTKILHLLLSYKHLNSLISNNKDREAYHVWQQTQKLFFTPGSSLFIKDQTALNVDYNAFKNSKEKIKTEILEPIIKMFKTTNLEDNSFLTCANNKLSALEREERECQERNARIGMAFAAGLGAAVGSMHHTHHSRTYIIHR